MMSDLAQQVKMAVVKYLIESVPRTIPQYTPPQQVPQTTTPIVKPENNVSKDTTSVSEDKHEKERKSSEHKPKKKSVIEKLFSREKIEPINFDAVNTIDGVHLDIFDYFDLSPSTIEKRDLERLQFVCSQVGDDVNKSLKKIQDIEIKLGRYGVESERLSRIYNWLKVRSLSGKS